MTSFKDNSTEEKWLKINHHLKLVDHPVPQSWVLWLMGLHSADQARIAELRAALEEIGHMGFDMPATLEMTDEAWRMRRTGMMQHIAREALKANEVKK